MFFPSYEPQLHSNLFSVPASIFGGVSDTAGSGLQEYRVISSSSSTSKNNGKNYAGNQQSTTVEQSTTLTPIFSFAYVTEGINSDILRTVFLISDVLILIYRMTRTCRTVRVLRRRFVRCRCGGVNSSHHRCIGSGSESSSVARFTATTVDGGVSGELMTTSFRSGSVAASDSQYRLQPCCHGDVANIYTDPQTLSVQNKIGNSMRTVNTSCSSLQRPGRNNVIKRIGTYHL
jgi:hypothetical protein